MGYNAYVICDCLKKGKTTAPPYSEFVKNDDEGLYLDIPELYKKDEKEYYKRHKEFNDWKRNACPHNDMVLVSERLANISGMSAFRTILNELGGEKRFPVLTKYLPVSNSGTLPPEFAEQALEELKDLEQEKACEQKMVLKVKDTGEKIQSTNKMHSYIFVWTAFNKHNYGIDENGFFIIENRKFQDLEKQVVIFRSKNFSQVTQGENSFLFTDKRTGDRFEGTVAVWSAENQESGQEVELIVEAESVTLVTEYQYIIEPLKKLANASVKTGNPVIWI